MGLFSFFKDAGKSILGGGNDDEAIKKEIEESLGEEAIDGLVVTVEDGKVTLAGVARDNATREKAILIAGNIEGVEAVDADQLVTPEIIATSTQEQEEEAQDTQAQEQEGEGESATTSTQLPEPRFYTIQEGDTLWKIAQEFYGDGNKYKYIVQENLEVIKNEDLIYPGQTIRVPELA